MSDEEEAFEEASRKCRHLLAKGRLGVLRKGPYFSQILHTLVPVMVPNLGASMAVTDTMLLLLDPIRIMNEPQFTTLNPQTGVPDEMAGALVHECMHILRDMSRVAELAKVDGELANIAADLAINTDLRRAGWKLPTWVVYPEKYDLPENLTMEQYFGELIKNAKDNKEKNQNPDVGSGMCGSAAGNSSDPAKAAAQQHAAKGRTQGTVDSAARGTAKSAEKFFADGGGGAGTAPGWVKEQLEKAKKRPERNWELETQRLVNRRSGDIMSGGADFSLKRPSRRSTLRPGMLRPGMIDQQLTVAMGVDVSGSMQAEQLNHAMGVALDVMAKLGLDTIWLGQFDTKMTAPFKRTPVKGVEQMEAVGRGGTNFKPVFAALEKLTPKPDLVMIYTDGDGPAPAHAPRGMVVIWVIVPSRWRKKPASWGHYVICSNDHDVADDFE